MSLTGQNLGIGYSDRTVGRALDVSLEQGEVLALLGPNGSGKTTLLRTLLGLLRPREGEVRVNGKSLAGLPPAEIAREIAYVPQAAQGFQPFRVREVVEMARAPHLAWYAAPAARDRAIAEEALAELGLADFAERDFAELSGGERQLVLIARALASEARILLLDEPTASLDYGNQFRVLDEITRLKARGASVLFTTHDPNQALRVCRDAGDRILTLARDGTVAIGPAAERLSGKALSALYGLGIEVNQGAHGSYASAVSPPPTTR